MSGVKRFEAHYLTEGVMGGKALACAEMVLASDYDRDTQALKDDLAKWRDLAKETRIERDALRAQVEAMREAALELRRFAGCNDVHHDRADQHEYDEPCKVLARIDAVLQEPKP